LAWRLLYRTMVAATLLFRNERNRLDAFRIHTSEVAIAS
jgi:hypothetical protein